MYFESGFQTIKKLAAQRDHQKNVPGVCHSRRREVITRIEKERQEQKLLRSHLIPIDLAHYHIVPIPHSKKCIVNLPLLRTYPWVKKKVPWGMSFGGGGFTVN